MKYCSCGSKWCEAMNWCSYVGIQGVPGHVMVVGNWEVEEVVDDGAARPQVLRILADAWWNQNNLDNFIRANGLSR